MLIFQKNIVLQIAVLVCLGIIGGLVYHNYSTILMSDRNISGKIDDIDVSCPKCPDLTNPIDKDDLDVTVDVPDS